MFRRKCELSEYHYELGRLLSKMSGAVCDLMVTSKFERYRLADAIGANSNKTIRVLSVDPDVTVREYVLAAEALDAHWEIKLVPNELNDQMNDSERNGLA